MTADFEAALELIGKHEPATRYYWFDAYGGRHNGMAAADLARAVLKGKVDMSNVFVEKRIP